MIIKIMYVVNKKYLLTHQTARQFCITYLGFRLAPAQVLQIDLYCQCLYKLHPLLNLNSRKDVRHFQTENVQVRL